MTSLLHGRTGAALLAMALAVGCAGAAVAQMPHLDPIPWFTSADSTSRQALILDLERFDDGDTRWAVNRVGLTVVLPAGARSTWFLRTSYLRLDTAKLPLGERWPEVLGSETAPNWPGETITSEFGHLEVGATGAVALPSLSSWRYGVALGLPSGSNRAYPFSSTSLPLRLQLRRGLELGAGSYLWLQGGYLAHLDATGDVLADTAFPNGFQVGAEWAWYRGRGSRLTFGYDLEDRDGRRSQIVGAAFWVPWGDVGSVGLRARYEFEDESHRSSVWYGALSVRFDGSRDDGIGLAGPDSE